MRDNQNNVIWKNFIKGARNISDLICKRVFTGIMWENTYKVIKLEYQSMLLVGTNESSNEKMGNKNGYNKVQEQEDLEI